MTPPPPECVNVSNVGNVDGEKLSDKKNKASECQNVSNVGNVVDDVKRSVNKHTL